MLRQNLLLTSVTYLSASEETHRMLREAFSALFRNPEVKGFIRRKIVDAMAMLAFRATVQLSLETVKQRQRDVEATGDPHRPAPEYKERDTCDWDDFFPMIVENSQNSSPYMRSSAFALFQQFTELAAAQSIRYYDELKG